VASLLLAAGKSRRSALFGSALLGAATLFGVLLMWVLRATLQYTLPISAGVTLYVAASDLMPEVKPSSRARAFQWWPSSALPCSSSCTNCFNSKGCTEDGRRQAPRASSLRLAGYKRARTA